ncbi:unnamed protein product [Schistosoma rodhaini]|uniref:AAA+ ATPase domain-containing protein n=2 Tax=Schistosoma rodhaini TaxID=6188 RepID=A0AA85ELT5_9TREM|nr:unnamed protein product [Schistosoma rodhaini]
MNEQLMFYPKDELTSERFVQKLYDNNILNSGDSAVLQALNKKPVCIILLGKPCSGKTELAKRLCLKWKLQLINAMELITENIDRATYSGKVISEVMGSGQTLDEKLVYNLITQKLESPECAHYGYVLDDLPTFSESRITIEDQIAYITSLNLKPDFIVHIKIPQEDIIRRREGLRIDVEDGTVYSSQNYTDELKTFCEPEEKFTNKITKVKQNKTEEDADDSLDNVLEEDVEAIEEVNEEEEEDQINGKSHPDFKKLNKNKLEYLVSRLEDNPEKMKSDLEYHEKNIESHITSYVKMFNPFNVIELDGNLTPTELFYNLLVKLQSMNLYPSVAPIRFFGSTGGGEEEEEEVIPEDIDTEELFKIVATKKMPGPRARWHKSPWKRLCPVALYEGQLSMGKPEFTVGFLGQVFCLANIDNFTSFMKNPRPYLLPPHPRPPFRVVVLGPKASGKTELIHILAESYRAKIIDIAGMLQEEYNIRISEKLKEIQEKTEAVVIKEIVEKQHLETQSLNTKKVVEDTAEITEQTVTNETEEQSTNDDKDSQEGEKTSELNYKKEQSLSSDSSQYLLQPVNKDHPEVKRRVAEALQSIKQEPIEFEVDFYINAVRSAVDEVETKLRNDNPGGPYHGQWIIDGLPVRPDVWRSFMENAPELLPDLIVYLQDTSINSEYLLRRWIKLKIEEFKDMELVHMTDNIESVITQDFESEQPKVSEETILLSGIHGQAALLRLKESEKLWTESFDLLRRTTQPLGAPVDVLELNITEKTIDQMRDEVLDRLVKPFKIEPIAKTQEDLDEEEEEDAGAFEEEIDEEFSMDEEGIEEGEEENEQKEGGEELEEEEDGEEEELDSSRNLQKQLGLTSYFCPVTLREYGVLRAGDPEIVAVYQNLIYYFSNEEARSKFIDNPNAILNGSNGLLKPPPPRILILGPTGTGKSLHSRQIALNLNLVHIDFLSLLQEITFPKLGKKIGKQYADQEPIPDIVLPPLEESVNGNDEKREASDNEIQKPNITEITDESDKLLLLDEHETNVYEYLLNSTSMPNDTLEWLLGKFWKQEPYKSTGFILDGFPQSVEDLQFLVTSNYFFDYAIFLTAEADEVVSRLLPPRLEVWRKLMAKKAENAAKLMEWKTAKKKLAMEKRRSEILKELEEKRENARIKQNSDDPDVEEDEELEDEVDIDEMLAEEFAEDEDEMEDEEEETEADVVERLTEEITETFNDSNDIFTEISEQIDELSIPKYEINAGGKITWARYRIVKRLHNLLENRSSLFERVYPITPKIAERLLINGYYFPSTYGRWCPVTLYFQNAWLPPLPMPNIKVGNPKYLSKLPGIIGETLPLVKAKTCAAVYKQHIYWFINSNARELFIKNPLKYTQKYTDPPFRVPLRLHIIGAPKTGKTTIAQRLAKEYNIPVINAGDSIRWILSDPSHMHTSLAIRIREQFNRGECISDELTAQAIQTLLMNGIYFTRGYILENYPLTKEQGELLSVFGVRPNLVIELVVKDEKQKEELIVRGITQASNTNQVKLSKSSLSFLTFDEKHITTNETAEEHYSENEPERNEEGFKMPEPEVDIAQELVIRLAAYDNIISQLKEWYLSRNGILVELEAVQNRWLLWRKVIYLIKHRMRHIEEYMERITTHKAASIAELGIEHCEYEKLSSEFRQYCPVTLRERQELENTIDEPKQRFVVQLNINDNQINKSDLINSTKHNLRKMLHNNNYYSSKENEYPNIHNQNNNINSDLATSIGDNNKSNDLNNLIYIHTSMRFTAEYEGRYYRMAGPSELQAFLANPTRYVSPNNINALPENELLPTRIKGDNLKQIHDSFPKQLALNGYCPVCFYDSKLRYEGLKLGLPEYLANYDHKIYAFCSNSCLLNFLRKPILFTNLQLPHKLPPVVDPITVKSLPLPGFLEQTLAVALRRALSAIGQERPKFPFITIKRSALIYMGLHLKAYNPRFPINEQKKNQQKLANYMNACHLIPWLAKSMPIQFISTSKRSMEFNTKLDQFLGLEKHKDLPETWIH